MAENENELTDLETIISEFETEIRLEKFPTIDQFQKRYPQFADEIRRFLPTVEALEQAKLAKKRSHSSQWKTPTIEKLGDFKILREIGRGGMGIVFEAEQVALARRVAIKVLPKHLLLSENALKRFHREAQTAAQLHHTNIVSILDVGEEDGLHYYVMQFIDGIGLNDLVKYLEPDSSISDESSTNREIASLVRTALWKDQFSRVNVYSDASEETQVSPNRIGINFYKSVARIALQVADALDYAHRNQVLHRDIKPANLMIQSDGKVWVMDFGVAKAFEDMAVSLTGDVVGTPRYMAPEQYKGKANAQSDIYSLGVTLFELITRRSADEAMRDDALPSAGGHLHPLKNLRRIDPTIPKDLETIVLRATALEPKRRYKNAATLAVDLQRFIYDQPILARRASTIEKTVRWCKQNRALATISSFALTLILGILALSIFSYQRERSLRQKIESALALSIDSLEKVYEQNSPNEIHELSLPLDMELEPDSIKQTPISKESAKMLEDLLPYYDQVANLGNDNPRLKFQAAKATQRVGEIHAQLGHWSRARIALLSAIQRYESDELADYHPKQIRLQLAQTWMALGHLNYRQYLIDEGESCYQSALEILSRADSPSQRWIVDDSQVQFYIARANFYLGTLPKQAPSNQVSRLTVDERRATLEKERAARNVYLDRAIAIIDQLSHRYPESAKCTHLKALCYRERSTSPDDNDIERSLRLLHELVDHFPDVKEFRLNLCETYASIYPPLLPDRLNALAIQRLNNALKYSEGLNQNTIRYKLMAEHTHNKLASLYVRLIQSDTELAYLGTIEEYKQAAVKHSEQAIAIHQGIRWDQDQVWSQVWLAKFRESLMTTLRLRNQPGDIGRAIRIASEMLNSYQELVDQAPDEKTVIAERDRWQKILNDLKNETDKPSDGSL